MNKLAEIEITYSHKPTNKVAITNSESSYEAFRPLFEKSLYHKELFYLLALNRANKILGFSSISSGGVSGTFYDPKIVFQTLLKCNASQFICCHNHPSGNLIPSECDRKLSKKLFEGGKLLDISMLDNMIIAGDKYFSFADEGMLE